MIPLFTIPVFAVGVGYISTILYRFAFGSAFMLAFLLYRQVSLRISWGDFFRIGMLSLMYVLSAWSLFASYKYISSGVATSFVYTNPIWCSVIGMLFFKERMTWRKAIALLLTTLGVMLLSGFFADDARFSGLGVMLGLWAGITYGIYLVLLPRLRISKMPSLKLTFYIFFIALLIVTVYALVVEGGFDEVPDTKTWINLMLLGVLPTAFSNICVTMALRLVDTTAVAILGAFEPLTAMVIGIVVLGEPCGVATIMGVLMVLAAVTILTWRSKRS